MSISSIKRVWLRRLVLCTVGPLVVLFGALAVGIYNGGLAIIQIIQALPGAFRNCWKGYD